MADHNDLGKRGEEMAVAWLREKGFEILHCNWRYSNYEIDIIAKKGNMLHFIEVKTAWFSRLSHPEQQVTRSKFKNIQRAANHFLHLHPGHNWIRYDIMAITLFKGKDPEYFLLEDVFL